MAALLQGEEAAGAESGTSFKIRIKITGFDAGEIFGGEGAALSALYTGREDGRGGRACMGNCAGFRRAGMNLCLCF